MGIVNTPHSYNGLRCHCTASAGSKPVAAPAPTPTLGSASRLSAAAPSSSVGHAPDDRFACPHYRPSCLTPQVPTQIHLDAVIDLGRSIGVIVVRAGMRRAQLEGQQIGRKRLDLDRTAIVRDRLLGVSLTNVATRHGVSRATVCRLFRLAGGPANVGSCLAWNFHDRRHCVKRPNRALSRYVGSPKRRVRLLTGIYPRCRLLVQVILPPTGLTPTPDAYTHARLSDETTYKPTCGKSAIFSRPCVISELLLIRAIPGCWFGGTHHEHPKETTARPPDITDGSSNNGMPKKAARFHDELC